MQQPNPKTSIAKKAWAQARSRWLEWLKAQGIAPARFQQQAWQAYADGQSGLISAPTGSGKTLAAIGGPLIEALALHSSNDSGPQRGVRILWITPLRALASDTTKNLLHPLEALLPQWRTAMRTGDASAKDRNAAKKGQVQLLVTTPESLAILLTSEAGSDSFRTLQCVVVDEWHELLPSKRGVLLQLNLARLRRLAPQMQVWGLSATIGNLEQAMDVLVRERRAEDLHIVQDSRVKKFDFRTLIPPQSVRIPWAGHLGLSNIGEVLKLVLAKTSSIIFTNTRAQAELWFTALSSVWPLEEKMLAIHHGSLDQSMRLEVENALRQQSLRCVIATSSLDLGVDFPAVDLVIQIGGAHSVSRTVQRAGRAKHRPGLPVQITTVATQAMDMCEFAATRDLAQAQKFERSTPLQLCMDVLSQHTMSMALVGGFDRDELLGEVRTTASYAQLSDSQWQQVLDFLVYGGQALDAYPQYRRLVRGEDKRYYPADEKVARRQRMAIGTIAEQSMVKVQFLRGARLGSVEEGFISKLSPGDVFNFAGRSLELFRVENLTAWVRKSSKAGTVTPSWTGGFLPFSTQVGQRMKALLAQSTSSVSKQSSPEMLYLQPLLQLQAGRSHVPSEHELLIEVIATGPARRRQAGTASLGQAWFIYPFAGRVLHEGLALLLAQRLSVQQKNTFAWACNHMGLMLVPSVKIDVQTLDWSAILSTDKLEEDLALAVNFSEISRRRFREIAQIAGLLNARIPGMSFNTRQLQVSAGLLFDVLSKYDPKHLLLVAAQSEAIERDLHLGELQQCLQNLRRQNIVITHPPKHTPFSFSLWAESMRGQLSNESWAERIRRAAQKLGET
ncbi:ligase-associated DNA damage response DEXH box helicase [Comamonas sp. Y33R10-2]|uniref:ligase-associated DNA damage response DEXH box helicase n=1 Tax=Comamonas sp. Y33R10-2 TaxID=2853257 RepID=UPI001C5C944B|nr:ligase-associated DNA damage response DEXH box helicase [Comamonas sp. Y33R10-2]QXZ09517.1 ligase-associated DNA damage response DEXH box helicase [Comamonas sp. Y33R10-2]